MKTNKKQDGTFYKFKKNSIEKNRQRYCITFHYVMNTILRYKKYLKPYQMNQNKQEINQLLLKIMEDTGKEFQLNNDRIYSSNSFNNKIKKEFQKIIKLEKKKEIYSDLNIIRTYKLIDHKNYKALQKLSITNPQEFLEGIYLYTICED